MVLAAAGGAGCHTGGTLTGSGGVGMISGVGGKAGGSGPGPIFTGASGSSGVSGCGTTVVADRVPARIMILLDTSASMNDALDGSGSKWAAAVGGIDDAIAENGHAAEWGLRFIGSVADSCNTGALEVAVAPDNASTLMIALGRRSTGGQLAVTGQRPASAAVNDAASYLLALPPVGNSAILLITDGLPNCDQGDPNASDLAGALDVIATVRNNGIPTFVVGMGALDAATDDGLSRMAEQGGVPRSAEPRYYPVTRTADAVGPIEAVVANVAGCTFAIPPPPSADGSTNREWISVFVDRMQVPQDANDGWTYGDSAHTTLTFHGLACDTVISQPTQAVSVTFVCPLL
jgi:hypothetical protein